MGHGILYGMVYDSITSIRYDVLWEYAAEGLADKIPRGSLTAEWWGDTSTITFYSTDIWWYMVIYGDIWWSMVIYGSLL